ncbi:phosphohistidine phosphatase [Thalassoglobus neptunius]|uniref:Phosphohistidine phosphatase n=1 Tax=Thalassoglobus neptunius TaxID=1938619 RepID=A0A5C5X7M8_9PLAN|nr:histidine phosphatase family protein [Thalassoglobus neptunius]TWT57962.1 phosphohistidine phosphatase [Thalassoglobus neptunius]
METLLIMRHAKSSWDNATLSDDQRPLNKRGKRVAPLMGAFLASQNLVPDRIVSSTAKRAHQTAKLMAAAMASKETLGSEIELVDELYLPSTSTWKRVIAEHESASRVLMIGHNPGIEELVSAVTGDYERMPTAAIACFSVGPDSESSLERRLKLQALWRPKELDLSEFEA